MDALSKANPFAIKMADTFDIFPRFPIEIRLSIWEATFPSRSLRFEYTGMTWQPLYMGPKRDKSEFVVDMKERLLADPLLRKPMWDTEPIPAEPILPIVALQVCQESRRCALTAGYRIWRERLEFDQPEDVEGSFWAYWNPKYDAVHLTPIPNGLKPTFQIWPLFALLKPGRENRVFIEQSFLRKWYKVSKSFCKEQAIFLDEEGMVEVWRGSESLQEMVPLLAYAYSHTFLDHYARNVSGSRKRIHWADDLVRDVRNTTVWPVLSEEWEPYEYESPGSVPESEEEDFESSEASEASE